MPLSLTHRALAERLPEWGVLVLESHHAPDFDMEWRTHAFIKVVYVLSGSGQLHFERRQLSFSTGDVFALRPGIRNRLEDVPGDAASLYVCCLAVDLLRFDRQLTKRIRSGQIIGSGHVSHRIATLMRRMAYVQSQPGATQAVSMVADALRMVQVLVDHAVIESPDSATTTSPEGTAIADYAEHLSHNFFEATTIDAAAAGLGLPRRTFTRLFAEVTGEAWLPYVRRLAIAHATRRLVHTDLPIAAVAFECGFNDLSTFYRQFKSHCGVSPARYRDQHRSRPSG